MYTTGINDTGEVYTGDKFAAGVVDTGGALWLVNIAANFRKIRNDPNVFFRGLGEDDSWKTWSKKSRDIVPLWFLMPTANENNGFFCSKATLVPADELPCIS